MIKFFAVAVIALATSFMLTGCVRTKEGADEATSKLSWKTSLFGQGKNVQGGSLDVSIAPAPPAPTPAPLEQLEKGNAAKVAAQVAAAKVTASVTTPICVGDTCYVPYANATGVRSSPPLLAATPAPSWYNGFLPD